MTQEIQTNEKLVNFSIGLVEVIDSILYHKHWLKCGLYLFWLIQLWLIYILYILFFIVVEFFLSIYSIIRFSLTQNVKSVYQICKYIESVNLKKYKQKIKQLSVYFCTYKK